MGDIMRGIVLSGGGSKGAYQVGVWKALRKLKIKYDIVTGTSIGSINGLMMVQGDYFKTVWLWRNICFTDLCDDTFPDKYDTLLGKTEIYKNYAKHFFKEGGMSMVKMRKLLEKSYNDNKFNESKINYGIVTFNLSKMKPLTIWKKDLKGHVIDYVLASSSCYPIFKKTEINGEKYIDGGYYDNVPINMALDMGADEIIVVDLESVGLKKEIKNENAKITYIRPRNDIGSFLVFDKNIARRAIRYGYYDTMKVYGKLDGNKYTFKKGNLNKNYERYADKFLDYCDNLFDNKDNEIYMNLLKIGFFARILKTRKDYQVKKVLDQAIEFLGRVFKIDDCNLYSIQKYNKLLLEKNNEKEQISKKFIEKNLKQKNFKEFLNTGSIVKYLYNMLDEGQNKKDLCALALVFPKELVGAIYLKIIK